MGVLAVARREEKLKETQALGEPGKIDIVAADVATEEGRQAIADAVEASGQKLEFVVQNAGVIGKVSSAMNIDYDSWRNAFAVNVDAPLFLTQRLEEHLAPSARILHIGSGAAHNAMDGWTAYCSTKAAFFMMYKCLAKELGKKGILVGSVKPGIVESPMQEEIRKAKTEDMEMADQFREFKANEYSGPDPDQPHAPPKGGLDTAANAAHFVHFLLTETSAEEFVDKEWDIREEFHHSRWVK